MPCLLGHAIYRRTSYGHLVSLLPVREGSTACFLDELLRGLSCLCPVSLGLRLRLCLSVQRAAAFRGMRLEASRLTRSSWYTCEYVRLHPNIRCTCKPTPAQSYHASRCHRLHIRHAVCTYMHRQCMLCLMCPSIHPCFVTLGKARHHDQAKQVDTLPVTLDTPPHKHPTNVTGCMLRPLFVETHQPFGCRYTDFDRASQHSAARLVSSSNQRPSQQ